MRIITWRLAQRTIALASQTECAQHRWNQFKGIYLRVVDDKGQIGFGEASPLEGHSPESLSQCHAALQHMLNTIKEIPFFDVADVKKISSYFRKSPASARFALESALLDICAKQKQIPLWRLFTEDANPSVQINTLVSSHDSKEHIETQYRNGVRVFKLKVGIDAKHRSELAMLEWMRATFGNKIEIRLDANGIFSLDEAQKKMNLYSAYSPSYIEEPALFNEAQHLKHAPIPMAADESLCNSKWHQALLEHPDYMAFVFKPSLHSGFFDTMALAQKAQMHNKKVVLTHMFESLPAFLAIAHLAVALKCQSACGLYPHHGLGDITKIQPPAFTVQQGKMLLHPTVGLGIDDSFLEN